MLLTSDIVRKPFFNYMINNAWVDPTILSRTTSLEVTTSDEKSDSAKIVIDDPDFLAFDSPNIIEGSSIEIYGGYVDAYEKLLAGHIAAIDPNFPATGAPQLTLVCMDESYPMSIDKKKYSWRKMKRSDIVKHMARNYGFASKVQDTKEIINIVNQFDENDIAFLQKLAQAVGFICYVRDKTIHFHERKLTGDAIETLSYNSGNSTLISFRPQFLLMKDVNSQNPIIIEKDVVKGKVNQTAAINKPHTKHASTTNPNNPIQPRPLRINSGGR